MQQMRECLEVVVWMEQYTELLVQNFERHVGMSLRSGPVFVVLQEKQGLLHRGFRLPVSHVIHTVGPIYHPDDHPEVSLQSAYRNCLKLAKENNIQYIAFPALSCGVYSYPFKDASIIAISTVKEFVGDFKEDNKITDTSSAQARGGKDIQGIPSERLNVTKEKSRQTRLEQYKNYESIPQSGGESEKECKPTKKGGMYYDFRLNTRSVKSSILHFQADQ